MSKKRRTFSPEFKTKIVLEALSGIKEINELAAEHQSKRIKAGTC